MSQPVTIGDATLYLGDCLEILPTLGKVDDIACKRIEDAYKQPDMFIEPPPNVRQADMDI